MFALAWGDGGGLALGRFAGEQRAAGAAVDGWLGVHEPQRWVCRVDGRDLGSPPTADTHGRSAAARFDPVDTWSPEDHADAPVANFVIRVVAPEARADILAQLLDQANRGDGVLAHPGCAGLMLAAEVGRAEAMLGISYWSGLDEFGAYATWAQTAPWKDVITPVTVDVPLRILTSRSTEENWSHR